MIVKTCATCAHRRGFVHAYWTCGRSGFYTEVQRRYLVRWCDKDFSGWEPRPGVLLRLKAFFLGWKDTQKEQGK